MLVDTTDDFANWSLYVEFTEDGPYEYVVAAQDAAGNIESEVMHITALREHLYQDPGILFKSVHENKIYFIDEGRENLLSLENSGVGPATLVSGNGLLGNVVNKIIEPNAIADNPNNDEGAPISLFVLDNYFNAIIRVNSSTGEQQIFSDSSTPDSVNGFSNPVDMKSYRQGLNWGVYVLDAGLDAILSIGINGNRSILSSNSVPDSVNSFSDPCCMALDVTQQRLLVVDANRIIAVSLVDGSRTLVDFDAQTGGSLDLNFAKAVTLDSDANRLLVLFEEFFSIVEIDLDTGEIADFSSAGIPNGLLPFAQPAGFFLDDDRLLVADKKANTIFNVDLQTGARSIFNSSNTQNNLPMTLPNNFTLDSERGRVLIFDNSTNQIFSVDPASGERSEVFSSLEFTNDLGSPRNIIVDDDRLLIPDYSYSRVYEVDLTSGATNIVASNTIPGDQPELTGLRQLVLTNENEIVLGTASAMYVIDRDTGTRTVLTSETVPDSSMTPLNIDVMQYDSTNHLIYFGTNYTSTFGFEGIYAVDVNSGVKTSISTNDDLLVYPFNIIQSIAMDEARNRLLVANIYWSFINSKLRFSNLILAIDLSTGERTLFASNQAQENKFQRISELLVDSENDRLLLLDNLMQAVYAFDLETGERVVLSR